MNKRIKKKKKTFDFETKSMNTYFAILFFHNNVTHCHLAGVKPKGHIHWRTYCKKLGINKQHLLLQEMRKGRVQFYG